LIINLWHFAIISLKIADERPIHQSPHQRFLECFSLKLNGAGQRRTVKSRTPIP